MFDLQAADPCFLGIAALQGQGQAAAFVAQRPQLIQGRIVAGRDKTAVAHSDRQGFSQGPAQALDQIVVVSQVGPAGLNTVRQAA